MKLPQPTLMDGTLAGGMGTYTNLKGGVCRVSDGFVEYVPRAAEQSMRATRGMPASEKRALMATRVRLREAEAKKRRRRKLAEEEAKELYDDFLGETEGTGGMAEVEPNACEVDDDESRAFWDKLVAESGSDSLFEHCVDAPAVYTRGMVRRSRLERLTG